MGLGSIPGDDRSQVMVRVAPGLPGSGGTGGLGLNGSLWVVSMVEMEILWRCLEVVFFVDEED